MFLQIMNKLNLFTKIYAKLHNYPYIPYWFLTPPRKLVRSMADKVLPSYLSKKYEGRRIKDVPVIVSLTSFPARINDVWQVVECMRRQTYKPSKMLLWLSKEQFPTSDSVPESLKSREDSFFEIRFVEGDIRSHKKYYYVLTEYPDSLVFLIDDDLYYSTDIIERSLVEHEKHPDSIICNYGFHITYVRDGKIQPYNAWKRAYKYSYKDDLFFGSGGGTLLKLGMLYEDVRNVELARNLTPIADDIWLNAMARLAKIPMILLDNGNLLPIRIKDNIKLATENMRQCKNDEQINDVTLYYFSKSGVNPFSRSNNE